MRALGTSSTLLALFLLAAPGARAQITEPNGTAVPVVDPTNFETDLVEFFGMESEAIDTFEDWEGANDTTWCGAGLTECQPGGTLVCRQQTPEPQGACKT